MTFWEQMSQTRLLINDISQSKCVMYVIKTMHLKPEPGNQSGGAGSPHYFVG